MKKLLLFGAGAYGLAALKLFGKENIYAFCDNSCKEISYKYGIVCLSFDKLTEILDEVILIITVNEEKTHQIVYQLESNEIDDYLIYDDLLFEKWEQNKHRFLDFLNDDKNRFKIERDQFFNKYAERCVELNNLKRLSDIKKLKHAVGYIGKHQDMLANFAKDVFKRLDNLKLSPFLCGGSLLGYYRHGDFIPWDDDLDFGLMRNDYVKLLDFGRANFIYIEQTAGVNDEDNERLIDIYRKYPEEFIMIVSPRCMHITRGTSEIDALTLDFFSYDFYSDNYSFDDFKKTIEIYREKYLYAEHGNDMLLNCIKNNPYISKTKTSHLYYGLDNMDAYEYRNSDWMHTVDVFPLKKIFFHGVSCFCPNEIEKLLPFYYKDSYMEYPESILCKHWIENSKMKLKRNYIYCGINIRAEEDAKRLMTLYKWLRKKGIYAVYYFKYDEGWLEECCINSGAEYLWAEDKDFDILYKDGTFIAGMSEEKWIFPNTEKNLEKKLMIVLRDKKLSVKKKKNCFLGEV